MGTTRSLALQQELCIRHRVGQNLPQIVLGISGQGFRFRGRSPSPTGEPADRGCASLSSRPGRHVPGENPGTLFLP